MVLERGKAGKMILSKLESDRVNKILQENNEICKSYSSQIENIQKFKQFFQWKAVVTPGKTTQVTRIWKKKKKNVSHPCFRNEQRWRK